MAYIFVNHVDFVEGEEVEYELSSCLFPAGRRDIDVLVRRFRSCALESETHLTTLHTVKSIVGDHPHLRFLIARAYHLRDLRRSLRRLRKKMHEENQAAWFGGGRQAHFLKKYGRYGAPFGWFVSGLAEITGCGVDCGFDEECWDQELPQLGEVAAVQRSPPCVGCRQRSCDGDFCEWLSRPIEQPYLEKEAPKRSIMLLTKLRAYVRVLRNTTLCEYNKPVGFVLPVKPVECDAEMDGERGEELQHISSGNVVLTEQNPGSSSIAAKPSKTLVWQNLCSSERQITSDYATDRWTYCKSGTWTTSQLANTDIKDFEIHLPRDFISEGGVNGDTPMFVNFKIYKYFETDIEIKIHVNSNKFQVGQLQFSFQYMEIYDGNTMNNIYVRSQLPHVLVNAGASNEATLYIPYKHILPYLRTTRVSSEQYLNQYLGTLKCYVVAPLTTGDKGPTECGISIFIRFPNCKFVGMRAGDIDDSVECEPEMMEAAAVMATGAVMNKVIGDFNCDNPTNSQVPQYLVPTASHSWSLGTGLSEPLHNLRLDNSNPGVGRAGIDPSETLVSIPCRVFGMLKHITWDSVAKEKNKTGYLLWSCDAHPQLSKDQFNKQTTEGGLDQYSCPPLTVVAGCYKDWRGGLEFRFDIIASMFHTGRLLIAYIPGFSGKADKITLKQARNSPHAEFSLQDSTSFTFVVPYIANTPWWPRKYSGPQKIGESRAPSKIVLFILNPLVLMESVSTKVMLIPYVRAAEDFEVAVPVQPANGLSDNVLVTYDKKNLFYPTAGSYPFRCTTYSVIGDGKVYVFYEGTAAFGTASTFHIPETPIDKEKQYMYGKAKDSTKMPIMTWVNPSTGKQTTSYASFIVIWYVEGHGNMGIPFPAGNVGEQYADRVAWYLAAGKPVAEIKPYLISYIKDSGDSSSKFTDLFFEPVVKDMPLSVLDDYIICNAEMGEERVACTNMLNPTDPLPSTSFGSFTFKEDFKDMKDMMRRYHLYYATEVTVSGDFVYGTPFLSLPIVPNGLPLDVDDPHSVFNQTRDGAIALISNAYIQSRGSIRQRAVISVTGAELIGAKVWIQHHPDAPALKGLKPKKFPHLDTANKFLCHGYGFYIQDLSVNSIIEYEVPFYQEGMYNLLRKPKPSVFKTDLARYITLGNVVFGLEGINIEKPVNISVHIFWSIGDDYSLSTFRGFNDVVFTDEVWTYDPVDKKKQSGVLCDAEMDEEQTCEPEMFSSIISGIVSTAAGHASSAAFASIKKGPLSGFKDSVITGISEALGDKMKECSNILEKDLVALRREVELAGEKTLKNGLLVNGFGNLLHVIANPTLQTLAISVANVLMAMLSAGIDTLLSFTSVLSKFFSKHWNAFSTEGLAGASIVPEGDDEDCNRSVLALIFTAVCALFGVTLKAPTTYFDFLKNITATAGLFNNIITLLKNCSVFITRAINWISGKLNPKQKLQSLLYTDAPEVEAWFEEVSFLTDARNKDRYLYDRSMLSRVFDARILGALLVSNGIDERKPGGKLIWDLYKEIRKLANDLCERGAHPDVRFETFPIWITGAPGIGKSFFTTEFCNRLLKDINFQQPGSLIYYISPGAKYWSGVQNPAVLVSDDMFQVSGTRLEDELANMFLICSSSVLNPPMAAVEDKERRLNPLLYIMNCNYSFPDLGSTSRCPEAVYRRRKYLIKCQVTPFIKNKYPNFKDASELLPEERANFAHLEFYWAVDVKNPNTAYFGPTDFDTLCGFVGEAFKIHIMSERKNFRDRMIKMYCLDPNFNDQNLITEIPKLAECLSLKEQMKLVKDRIAGQLDELDDPRREKTFLERARNLIMGEPEMFGLGAADIVKSDTLPSAFTVEDVLNFKLNQSVNLPPNSINDFATLYPDFRENFKFAFEHHSQPHCLAIDQLYRGIEGFDKAYDLPLRKLNFGFMSDDPSGFGEHVDKLFRNSITAYENINMFCSVMFNFYNSVKPTTFEQLRFMLKYTNRPKWLIEQILKPTISFDSTNQVKHGYGDVLADKITSEHIDRRLQGLIYHSDKNNLAMYVYEGCKIFFKNSELPDAAYEFFFNRYSPGDGIGVFRMQLDSLLLKAQSYNSDKVTITVVLLVHKLYSMYLFLYSLLGDCRENQEDHKKMSKLFENSTCLTREYCNIRNVLVVNDVPVRMCPNKFCLHHDEITYLMGCWLGASCYRFKLDPKLLDNDGNPYYLVDWNHFNYTSMFKERRGRRIDENKVGFLVWCKDLVCHKYPKVIEGIIYVIETILPIILSVASTVAVCYGIRMGLKATTYLLPDAYGQPIRDGIDGKPMTPVTTVSKEANYFKFDSPKCPAKPAVNVAIKAFGEGVAVVRNVMANKINRNACLLYVTWIEGSERRYRQCRCLMLGGRNMLVLKHYIEEYAALKKAGKDLAVKLMFGDRKNNCCDVSLKYENICDDGVNIAWACNDKFSGTSNFGILRLPMFVPQFPKIYHLFATQSQHSNVGGVCDIYSVAGDSKFGLPLRLQKQAVVRESEHTSRVVMDSVYAYSHHGKGVCGSVVVSPNLGNGNGAIIGMHVAGTNATGDGFAEPLVFEMFKNFFEINPFSEIMEPVSDTTAEPKVVLDSNLLLLGCVPPSLSHKESGKSKILPSLLHNKVYDVVTEINPLKPNDPRQPEGSDPLRDGCIKHGTGHVIPYDNELIEEVESGIKDIFFQVIKPVRVEVKPLDLQTAVCGSDDIEQFRPLTWNTSEGFPLSSTRPNGEHGKKYLFDLEQKGSDRYVLKGLMPKLVSELKLRDECFKKNIKPPTVYIDCLKDYRLKPEKCRIPGKTRIFSIAPIQCSLDMRVNLGDFMASIKASKIVNSIGIGINPDSLDWTKLVLYLNEVGTNIITLDYKNFGPSLMSQLVNSANQCVVDWHIRYKAPTLQVERVKWLLDNDILNPVHLCNNVLYQTVNGIASGSPVTSETNSISNLFYIRLTYMEIMKKEHPDFASMFYFNQFVRLVVYGDDLIMSVSDDIIGVFNAVTIHNALLQHGIEVTSAQKDAKLEPFNTLKESTFLKRTFREHPSRPGIWLGPVDLDSVQECVNWIHQSPDDRAATLQSCEASLDLAYSHGPEYYERHRAKLIAGCVSIGLVLNAKTWVERDREIFGSTEESQAPKFKQIVLPWDYQLLNKEL